MRMRSGGARVRKRSKVSRSKDLPTPRMSRNCLGVSSVEAGQKREPTPPAIMVM